ncbi:MAG: AbrB/MazE/SpoVT family DNA-binding domain-containing protein [Clostridia bacterium]|nr:AbrB/MazE/SpoVT family DNA-binding domain-containing protein [Clostridia bacterium]
MKSTGMIRPVDKMGRVVIPNEIRKQLKIKSNVDSLEIYVDGENIILRKFQPTCIFCNNLADCIEYEGHTVCNDCIEKLKAKKDKEQN